MLYGKKLTEKQISTLALKRKSPAIKGFLIENLKTDGRLILDDSQAIRLLPEISPETVCPKCGSGKILKGKTAWGCSNFRNGCDFRVPFEI
jgi:DNA topoisomerase-3